MNNGERQYTEVGNNSSNNPQWKPNKENLVPGAPFPFLEGYFKSLREITGGPNGPFNVATIATLNPDGSLGQEVDVAGGPVLDNKLEEIALGTWIRIQYEGKQQSKTGGRTYNVWKTFADYNAIPYAQLGGIIRQQPSQQPPVQQQTQQPVFNPQQGFGGQPVFTPPAGNMQQGQTFNPPPAQQHNTGFQQQGQPVFTPPAQTFQQPSQQPPVQQQQWTPPAQTTQVPAQQQTQGFHPQGNQHKNQAGNVFGGNQMGSQSNDLPF